MTNIDRLDEVYAAIYRFKRAFMLSDLQNKLNEDVLTIETPQPYPEGEELIVITKKLMRDGYLEVTGQGIYRITFEGVIFFENTPANFLGRPYKFGQNQQRRNQIWTNVKIVATVINAVIIISIGIATCKVSQKAERLETRQTNSQPITQK